MGGVMGVPQWWVLREVWWECHSDGCYGRCDRSPAVMGVMGGVMEVPQWWVLWAVWWECHSDGCYGQCDGSTTVMAWWVVWVVMPAAVKLRSITLQNYMDPNQGVLHLWSKFGDPRLHGWSVMAWTSPGLTHTHTRMDGQTDAGNNNTRRQKLAWGKKWLCQFFDIVIDQGNLSSLCY